MQNHNIVEGRVETWCGTCFLWFNGNIVIIFLSFFQGIGCTFNQLGNAGGFFFGPWLVHLPGNHSKPDNTTSDTDVEDLRRAIYDYMWISKL